MTTTLRRAPAILVFCMLLGTPAVAGTKRIQVAGLGGRHCSAYFHYAGDELRFPVMLSLRGTGVYSTAATTQLDSSERALIGCGAVTVLTLDKPGVRPAPESPERVEVDDQIYNTYVQDDLIACSTAALKWAYAKKPSAVLLSGHSEGAQVSLRLYQQLLANGDALGKSVRALFLSGLPMTDWRAMLNGQLTPKQRPEFFQAFARRDDQILRSFGNLSFRYLAAAFALEPLPRTLDQLAQIGTTALFNIYQGLKDERTPVGPVEAFVADNLRRAASHGQSLRLKTHYYDAGHSLNAQALTDIRRDVEEAATSPSPPAHWRL